MASALSNSWNDVHLIKLDPTPGSEGPVTVVQQAVDSNDPTQKVRMWLLRSDGQWIDLAVQLVVPKEQRPLIWFENIREVMTLLGSLPAHPQVFQHVLSEEERAEAIGRLEQLNLETIRELVRQWKEEHEVP